MTALARVQLHGKQGFVTVNPKATEGARIGSNVWNADGTLFVPATAATPEQDGVSVTLWSLVQEIPANVQQVEALATSGVVRRDGSGNWSASAIVNADLAGADTDGLAEAANLYFTNARADARIAAYVATLAGLTDAVDDAAAATAGVPVGAQYRTGSTLKVRIT